MKRILALFVSALLAIVTIPALAFADTTQSFTERYTVLILDTSSSMSGEPFTAQEEAAKKFCAEVLEADGENKVAIVKLASSSSIACDFTDDIEELNATIESFGATSATNTNAALEIAKALIDEVPSTGENVVKNIVLCSDGLPQSGDRSYEGPYESSDSSYYMYANACYATAAAIKESSSYYIYTLGFFHDLTGETLGFARRLMNDLQNAGYYEVEDPNDLDFAFGEVADEVTDKNTISGQFRYAGEFNEESDSTADYHYSDDYFFSDPNDYHRSLSTMSLNLELSTWSSHEKSAWYDPELTETDPEFWEDKLVNVKTLLLGNPNESDVEQGFGGLGFSDFSANEFWSAAPEMDSIGAVAAKKHIRSSDGDEATLVALVIRGGGYFDEWSSNVTVGLEGDHEGFAEARDNVISFLKSYLNGVQEKDNLDLKLWIVGYSRAGVTANMVAGAINEQEGLAAQLPEISDVFCYCFEPPMGTQRSDITGEHKNIHNVVNLNDIVPYVAPGAWGFSNYNSVNNWYLPDATVESTYPAARAAMIEQLEALGYSESQYNVPDYVGDYNLLVDFSAILPSGNPFLQWKQDNSEVDTQTVLSYGVDYLSTDLLRGREGYVNRLQQTLRNALKIAFGYEGTATEAGEVASGLTDVQALIDNVCEIISPSNMAYILGPMFNPNPLKSLESRLDEVNERIYEKTDESLKQYAEIVGLIPTITDCLTNILGDVAIDAWNGNTDTANLISQFAYLMKNGVFTSHFPEPTLAWLRSQDPQYTSNPGGTGSGETRIIRINCPVDVTVKDASGTAVASIVGNVPERQANGIVAYVNADGEKVVHLPGNANYMIDIIATDDGSVSYSVTEKDGIGPDQYQQGYYDIPVSKGNVIQAFVPAMPEDDGIAAYSLEKDGSQIQPDETLMGDAADTEHTVTLTADVKDAQALGDNQAAGGRVEGAGIYRHGAFAKAQATPYPNATFHGWFDESGNLVSQDAEYRFAVRGDMKLTARFEAVSFNELTVVAGLGGSVADGSGLYTEGMEIQLAATPNEGFAFDHWTSSSGKIADPESPETTILMTDKDTTVRALFKSTTPDDDIDKPAPLEYDINVEETGFGKVTCTAVSAEPGLTIEVMVDPAENLEVVDVVVTSAQDNNLGCEMVEEGTYSFKMPLSDVTVVASFRPTIDMPFTDVNKTDWFHDPVWFAKALNLMNGYAGSRCFGPNDPLSREQAAAVLYNLLGEGDTASPDAPQTDVEQGEWYSDAVNWAVDNGIMNGYSDSDEFGIGDPLTREQFAAIVANASNAKVDGSDRTELNRFPDKDGVSEWAVDAVAWAIENGIINGVELADGTRELCSTETMNRAQMAAMMVNAIDSAVFKLE